ncbi:glycosyl hydrolases family 2,F5/8 type C domain-containing protein [Owenweeksia hongkongensis DSM 17368]|uniref:Glycosyl hydrolases family 2,F5/8 type C domain-containing protein n=2 Tax=Owenweeksia TaxID=267986 RepID=G8R310_OWEHD|nr:glycosyl hydrolases family 2,F5/8 type C domain-containing protein [Owenweeksia hongkongensis DSM 17368]
MIRNEAKVKELNKERMKRQSIAALGSALMVMLTQVQCSSSEQSKVVDADISELRESFKTPPNEAKPRVWWHWMNGNISKEGIKKDLLWMHRVGIGGFQNFDAGLFTPQIVDKRLTYMTPEWKKAFAYTTHLADSLGLEMAIAASPGWSETGGPWVEPKDGMKKLVWSSTGVEGGKNFSGVLPAPPSVTGVFQNVKYANHIGIAGPGPEPGTYYNDVRIIAYKLSDNDKPIKDYNPKITSSGGNFNLAQLTDGDLATTSFLPPKKVGEYVYVQYGFDEPTTISSVTVAGGGEVPEFNDIPAEDFRTLEVSDDGVNFKKVQNLPLGKMPQVTYTFDEPLTAKYYRFNFMTEETKPNRIAVMMGIPQNPPKPEGVEVAEINLHTTARIADFEEKAGYGVQRAYKGYYNDWTPASDDAVDISTVVDVTDKMEADGKLNWEVPAGKWKVLRFGYSLTGRQNHPASPEATGLEVDKLDADAVRAYINNFLDQYKDASQNGMGDGGPLDFIITDSWEAGVLNWTEKMPEEFEKRRGYSLIPWMPTLVGEVVQSPEASDRFLWDFRRTLGEMIKENHYDVLGEELHKRGMGRYTESHEVGRAYVGDGMAIKSKADVPMSAFWTPGAIGGPEEEGPAVRYQADIRESSSTSHLYGQKYVAAESMTAIMNSFAFHPEKLKPTADMELASGLNRYVIHTSVHQPSDDKIPGLGLGPFGQWFTRHETWAEQAKPWISYLSRGSYMLQQGQNVADVVYYYGQDNNITSLYAEELPAVPKGYSFDFINADAIRNELSYSDGTYSTKSGVQYRILALDSNSKYMSLDVMKKIAEFAKAGGVVVGPKPVGSPSQTDDQEEVTKLINEVWGGSLKNVMVDASIASALESQGIKPDMAYTGNADLRFVHRTTHGAEIYWISNCEKGNTPTEATFRVSGRKPELWNPQTGEINEVSYTSKDGLTTVPLNLVPNDAIFIVFTSSTDKASFTLPEVKETVLATVNGPWNVEFQAERGAPASATFEELSSWTENTDAGIKYFSGTAAYINTVNVTEGDLKKGEIELDLGEVKNIAEVFVNGKSQGIVWKKPFKVNITEGLKAGENEIKIEVTNLWVNRLIGDAQPGIEDKITYTAIPFYKAEDELLTSGLIGPVGLVLKVAE